MWSQKCCYCGSKCLSFRAATDIGSNNLFSRDPRDILGALWPVDIRAARGVSHMDMLTNLGVSLGIKTLLDI